jgi:hypothetical protein
MESRTGLGENQEGTSRSAGLTLLYLALMWQYIQVA